MFRRVRAQDLGEIVRLSRDTNNASKYSKRMVSFDLQLKCHCNQKSIYVFFVFQNYATEPLSDRSFKPLFHNDTSLF